ncbi:MAG: zinc-ribbon domain-containing protein [Oscillospiraceae bacterium]|nr:zinc-ribbon domain-containing protein [Oscillospiraceae bacterium]
MSNSLAAMRPELVREWSDKNLPLTPDKITYGSNKIVWWKAACGHEWQTSVKARSKGENCPICSGARVVEGINDLATLKPELAQEWSDKNEIKSTEVSIGSHKKVIWKCRHGHEWEASIKSRTINRTGCPYCSHNKVLEGFNDLASQMPKVAAEWSEKNYPLLPTMVTPFANRKVWWKCSKGHEWHTLISTRSGGSKCPYCSGQILLKGFNDFATTQPQLAEEWSDRNLPLMPDMINEKSRKNVWWKCKTCGNEWKSVVYARIKGTVCPVCEQEYHSVFPQLAVSYYAGKKGLQVRLNTDTEIGLPLETYIVNEGLAIESKNLSEEKERLKAYICRKQGIKLLKLPYKTNEGEIEYIRKIKKAYQSVHIFIASDDEKDAVIIRKRFQELRKQIYQSTEVE